MAAGYPVDGGGNRATSAAGHVGSPQRRDERQL